MVLKFLRNFRVPHIQSAIHSEVLVIGYKLLSGVVLSILIVFSVIQLGGALQRLSGRLENGPFLEIIGFSILALACFLIFYFIFYRKETNKLESANLNFEKYF